MTRQDFIKKWAAYALALVLTAALQELLFSHLRPLGVVPVLLPLALAALAALEGAAAGAGFGIAVGVFSMFLDGMGAWIILLGCLAGLVTGLLARYVLSRSFLGFVVCSLGMLVLRMACLVVTYWLRGAAPIPVLLRVGGLELGWTMLLCPVIYGMFRFIYPRWGAGYYA